MTSGASVMAVPQFRFARMASTSTWGDKASLQRASGSIRTGISPWAQQAAAVSAVASRAVTSSTRVSPRAMAWEKATVRRMAVGRGRSVMATAKPARWSRRATPEARSPAPRIKTRMISLLYWLKEQSSKVMTA